MSRSPLALHITFGTKGTRLHGDERGTVDRSMNKPGDPIIGSDEQWEAYEYERLKHPPVYLAVPQRLVAEAVVPSICVRGGWEFQVCAARADHVHVLLRAEVVTSEDGKAVRKWLKRWLGEELTKTWPLAKGASWFTVGGSVKWVWTNAYFDNVYVYVLRHRTTPAGREATARH